MKKYYVYHIKRTGQSLTEGYIGISCNYKDRWRQHKKELKTNTHTNPHLQNAWNKYSDIEFVLLHVCSTADEMVNYEAKYRPTPAIGWNCKSGGKYNFKQSAETRAKIANWNAGKKFSEESKQKMSISAKTRPSNRKGTTHSERTKLLLRNANLGKKASVTTRKKISENQAIYKIQKLWIHISGLIFYGAPWEFSYYYPEQSLTTSSLGNVYTGKQKQHKGWYLFE